MSFLAPFRDANFAWKTTTSINKVLKNWLFTLYVPDIMSLCCTLTALAEPVLVFLSVSWMLSEFADPLQAFSNTCGTLTAPSSKYCATLTARLQVLNHHEPLREAKYACRTFMSHHEPLRDAICACNFHEFL